MFSGVPSRFVKSADSALAGTRSRCRDESYAARWRAGAAPIGKRCSEAELIELIDQLLEAERPRAAFHSVSFASPLIETSRLKRLLRAVATVAAEPAEHYRLDPYQLSKSLKTLSGRPNVGRDEMAQLEFLYFDALDRSEHGTPNLDRQIVESPALFVEILALAYRCRDGGQDPPKWRIDDRG